MDGNGAMEGGAIGQSPMQNGLMSRDDVHKGCFSPFTHTHSHEAAASRVDSTKSRHAMIQATGILQRQRIG